MRAPEPPASQQGTSEAPASLPLGDAHDRASTASSNAYSHDGPLPPVSPDSAHAAVAEPSASERAYEAKHEPTVVNPGGEPLPVLKDLFFADTTEPNFRVFQRMIDDAPVRPDTHGVRTPISPADGFAAIITSFVLRVAEKYVPFCKQHRDTKQLEFLEKVIGEHLALLDTPNDGPNAGGQLRTGIDGKLDALIDATRPGLESAVNQTAVTVLTLEQMLENPDPMFKKQYGKRIDHLLALLTPEFKRQVLDWYPADRPIHDWQYGSSGQLEDQSHLMTTYSQLLLLGRSKSKEAPWYRAQAERLARAYPRVKKDSWDGLSEEAGSL